MTPLIFTSLVFGVFAAFIPTVSAAPGDLDPIFGAGGKVTSSVGGKDDISYSVALQLDGKIIVAGYMVNSGNTADFALARYTASGAPDTGFGNGGKVTTDFAGKDDFGYSVALQPDGKIVVAGFATNASGGTDFAMARYTTAGVLDTGFGTGGKVTTDFAGKNDFGSSLALQPDGKIIVAGYTINATDNANFALARYTASGVLDTGFGTGGKVTTGFGTGNAVGFGVALQADGKILVTGYSDLNSTISFALARYTASGAQDAGFGTGGRVTTSFGDGSVGYSVAVQPDGKIVVAGASTSSSGNYSFSLARYSAGGILDPGFGNGGKVMTSVFGRLEPRRSVAIQGDGKIVVAGNSTAISNSGNLALMRYTASGALDTAFGIGGTVSTRVGSSSDKASSIALQPDGKIVVVGSSTSSNGFYDFAVVRYVGDTDTVTLPPTLTAPASGSASTNRINVAFTLPESALPGSVKLTFTGTVTRVLILASVHESTGAHAFTFDARYSLTSADIASGVKIPDGIYSVALSYQDALGNPVAFSASALDVAVNIDTDGDGILDRYETGTGIYVSPTDTGTDPNNPDTDGDGLSDGDEVNKYHTNPNLKDTDGDGFDDAFEVATGFDPTSASSTPDVLSTTQPAVEYRFTPAVGVSCWIEASTDLANWSTIETSIIGTGGMITRFFTTGGQPQRFFRVGMNPAPALGASNVIPAILPALEYRFNAALGVSYRIEASTDLANWSTIETPIIGTGGVISRSYSTDGQPKRYLRSRRN